MASPVVVGRELATAQIQQAEKFIAEHEYGKAYTVLSELVAKDPKNAQAVLWAAEAAPTGVDAQQVLEQYQATGSLNLAVVSELVRLYYAIGDYGKIMETTERVEKQLKNKPLPADVLFLAGQAAGALGSAEWAQYYFDLLQQQRPGSLFAGWAELGSADLLAESQRTADAVSEYQTLSQRETEQATPVAIEQLTVLLVNTGDLDGAFTAYNLYRDRYPDGLGLPRLQEKLRAVHDTGAVEELPDGGAQKRWSLQAGVFGNLENAQRMLKRYQAAGYPVEMTSQVISGKKLFSIFIGSYATEAEARRKKAEIETKEKEVLKLVIR